MGVGCSKGDILGDKKKLAVICIIFTALIINVSASNPFMDLLGYFMSFFTTTSTSTTTSFTTTSTSTSTTVSTTTTTLLVGQCNTYLDCGQDESFYSCHLGDVVNRTVKKLCINNVCQNRQTNTLIEKCREPRICAQGTPICIIKPATTTTRQTSTTYATTTWPTTTLSPIIYTTTTWPISTYTTTTWPTTTLSPTIYTTTTWPIATYTTTTWPTTTTYSTTTVSTSTTFSTSTTLDSVGLPVASCMAGKVDMIYMGQTMPSISLDIYLYPYRNMFNIKNCVGDFCDGEISDLIADGKLIYGGRPYQTVTYPVVLIDGIGYVVGDTDSFEGICGCGRLF